MRLIGYGLIASFYALQVLKDGRLSLIDESYPMLLLSVGMFGVLAIVLDYLQYVAGYCAIKAALKQKDHDFAFNRKWTSYRLRSWFFVLKQMAAALGALALAALMVFDYLKAVRV